MNEELVSKYITPRIWDGWLWLDGGWGPRNDVNQTVAEKCLAGVNTPVYIHPYVELDRENGNRELNERYRISFPGKNWKDVIKMIQQLQTLGVKEQRWTLDSHLRTTKAIKGDIYRLLIIAGTSPESIEVRVLEGDWIPSFRNTQSKAGWIVNAK